MIEVEQMEAFPPDSNPFHHDAYRMGMRIGHNVTVMFERHDNQVQNYIIVVNTETGERIRVRFIEGGNDLG